MMRSLEHGSERFPTFYGDCSYRKVLMNCSCHKRKCIELAMGKVLEGKIFRIVTHLVTDRFKSILPPQLEQSWEGGRSPCVSLHHFDRRVIDLARMIPYPYIRDRELAEKVYGQENIDRYLVPGQIHRWYVVPTFFGENSHELQLRCGSGHPEDMNLTFATNTVVRKRQRITKDERCFIEELHSDILYMIIFRLAGDSLDDLGAVLRSFGLASKSCHRACLGFAQNKPTDMTSAIMKLHTKPCLYNFYNWLIKNKVKLSVLFTICTSTIEFNIYHQIALECDLSELHGFIIRDKRYERKRRHEKILIQRSVEAGFPFQIFDEGHSLQVAMTENAASIRILGITIYKESFHQPILSKFAFSLLSLDLKISAMYDKKDSGGNHNYLQDMCKAIENMPHLSSLQLYDMCTKGHSINIRSKSLQTLISGNFFLSSCVCPSLELLHLEDECFVDLEGDIEEYINSAEDMSTFQAGVENIKMADIDVPETCEIRISIDSAWNPDDGY